MTETPYYYGRAENKLNSKGQVALPARFRSVLPEIDQTRNFVLIRGAVSCLYLYTHRQFIKIKDNARRYAEERRDGDFFRNFMAEAAAVEVDTQGRFVPPQQMLDMVGIKGPGVLFIGVDDRIEIWEPSLYVGRGGTEEAYEKKRQDAAEPIFGI